MFIVARGFWSQRALLALFGCFLFALTAAAARGAETEKLEFVTASGAYPFQVEIARTMEEREVGLMYRRSLLEDGGMLFVFHSEENVAMWMKNTYIPLDMIFVSKKGRVLSIARDAKPLSEDIIPSGKPAFAVIELNGGTAAKIGLAVGDVVRHPSFRP